MPFPFEGGDHPLELREEASIRFTLGRRRPHFHFQKGGRLLHPLVKEVPILITWGMRCLLKVEVWSPPAQSEGNGHLLF